MKLSYANTRNWTLLVATLLLTGILGCKAADNPTPDSQVLADESSGGAAESNEMDISKYKVGEEIAVYTRGYASRETITHIDGDGNLYEGKYTHRKIEPANIIGYILPETKGFQRMNAVKIRHRKSNYTYQGFVLVVYERGLTIAAANDPRGYEMQRYFNWADIEIEHVLVPQWTPEMLKWFVESHKGLIKSRSSY